MSQEGSAVFIKILIKESKDDSQVQFERILRVLPPQHAEALYQEKTDQPCPHKIQNRKDQIILALPIFLSSTTVAPPRI